MASSPCSPDRAESTRTSHLHRFISAFQSVTPLTIGAWLRNAGMATRGGGMSQATPEVFQRLAELHELIVKAEEEIASLRQEYAALKRKL